MCRLKFVTDLHGWWLFSSELSSATMLWGCCLFGNIAFEIIGSSDYRRCKAIATQSESSWLRSVKYWERFLVVFSAFRERLVVTKFPCSVRLLEAEGPPTWSSRLLRINALSSIPRLGYSQMLMIFREANGINLICPNFENLGTTLVLSYGMLMLVSLLQVWMRIHP